VRRPQRLKMKIVPPIIAPLIEISDQWQAKVIRGDTHAQEKAGAVHGPVIDPLDHRRRAKRQGSGKPCAECIMGRHV
jgi:hypothetical protein